jgi:hypothetical protein
MMSHLLIEPVEAIEIDPSDQGRGLVAMVDFRIGTSIMVERQADLHAAGAIFGWEGDWIANYRERGWGADVETVFWVDGCRYVTLNLPPFAGWGGAPDGEDEGDTGR